MPIYEYRCKNCGSHFEKRQKVSDEPLKVCESCQGELEKQWSLSGFSFKGEGWYVTDYASKKGGSGGGKDSAEKTSSADSTSSKDTASKPTGDKPSTSSTESSKS